MKPARTVAQEVVNRMPPVQMAFAHGFKFFGPQYNVWPPVIDLILAVDNAADWHKKNLHLNKEHYTLKSWRSVVAIQGINPGLYYNSTDMIDGYMFKYGVIETQTLKEQLRTWQQLYVVALLQTPGYFCVAPEDTVLERLLRVNREAAIACAAMMLPQCRIHSYGASRQELFIELAALIYPGALADLDKATLDVKMLIDAATKNFSEDYDHIIEDVLVRKSCSSESEPRYVCPKNVERFSLALPEDVRQIYQGKGGENFRNVLDPWEHLKLWSLRIPELFSDRIEENVRYLNWKSILTVKSRYVNGKRVFVNRLSDVLYAKRKADLQKSRV